MRRHVPVQRAALQNAITCAAGTFNPVMRVGAFSEGLAEKAALDAGYSPTPRGKIPTPQRAGHPRKTDGSHRQLFPVTSGTGSGSQCPAGLGITAHLNVEFRATAAVNYRICRQLHRRDTGSGRTSICSAVQRWLEGGGSPSWTEAGTIPAIGST